MLASLQYRMPSLWKPQKMHRGIQCKSRDEEDTVFSGSESQRVQQAAPPPPTRLLIFHSPIVLFTPFLALPCFSVSHFCHAHLTVHILAAFPLPLLQGHLKHCLLPRASFILPDECFHAPPTQCSYVLLRTLVLCCSSSLYCQSSEVKCALDYYCEAYDG